MLINLSTTRILMDLSLGKPAGRMVPGDTDGIAPAREALAAAPGIPLGMRLLPRALREGLARRAERRALASALRRLGETSPHLLADIGLAEDPAGVRPSAPKVRPLVGPWPAEMRPVMPDGFRIAAE